LVHGGDVLSGAADPFVIRVLRARTLNCFHKKLPQRADFLNCLVVVGPAKKPFTGIG